MARAFVYLLVLSITVLTSCSSVIKNINTSEVYNKNHTGFYLYDPVENKVLAEVNSHKYFTPASNTKIFTFYTALKILGDSIPAFKYRISVDSLVIWGTGDPSFLNYDYDPGRILDFLKSRNENIYFSFDNFKDQAYGPGWAWDDYPYYFQPEKCPFPVFGNLIHLRNRPDTAGLTAQPEYFKKFIYPETLESGKIQRDLFSNLIFSGRQPDSIAFDTYVPFRYTAELAARLLEDTLHREVRIADVPPDPNASTYFSIPADSLYKKMMQVSDNFFAEQILLMCAGEISDTLNTQIAIDYSKANLLQFLTDKPIWIDGSGLSRYNLFTPRSIVQLWYALFHMLPQDRLFNMLASGGNSGTISEWYRSDQPYIWGKTGTLSNNHSLSGFLKTRKGRILIFSFMHNNYITSSTEIKREMEKTLYQIHEKY